MHQKEIEDRTYEKICIPCVTILKDLGKNILNKLTVFVVNTYKRINLFLKKKGIRIVPGFFLIVVLVVLLHFFTGSLEVISSQIHISKKTTSDILVWMGGITILLIIAKESILGYFDKINNYLNYYVLMCIPLAGILIWMGLASNAAIYGSIDSFESNDWQASGGEDISFLNPLSCYSEFNRGFVINNTLRCILSMNEDEKANLIVEKIWLYDLSKIGTNEYVLVEKNNLSYNPQELYVIYFQGVSFSKKNK